MHVIDEPAWNAFVMPSGDIFVFTGLLRDMEQKKDDYLAAVIGHEMALRICSGGAVRFEAAVHQNLPS